MSFEYEKFGYEADQIYNEILKRGNEYSNDRLASLFKSFWEFRDKFSDSLYSENISLKMQVDALKKENDVIWKKHVEDLAGEKIKNRELQENYRAVLEHGRAEGII